MERVLFSPGGASETTLAAVLAELSQKLEAGQAVALDEATIAALQAVTATVSNLPATYPLPSAQITALTPPADNLTDAELRASPVEVSGAVTAEDSGEREATHIVATVTASGSTTIHTPAAGKAIRLLWFYAVNDPTALSAPLIDVALGARPLYRAWALSKRQRATGAVDAPLTVSLSTTGNVAVTAILQEV